MTATHAPNGDNEGSIGTSVLRWANAYFAKINGAYPVTTSYAQLSSDQSTSSTSLSDVSGMSIALAAGATYRVQVRLLTTSNATTIGVKTALNYTGTGTINGIRKYNIQSNYNNEQITAFDTSTMPTSSNGSTPFDERFDCIVTTTTAGNLVLRSASETSTSTTVKAGSLMIVQRIA